MVLNMQGRAARTSSSSCPAAEAGAIVTLLKRRRRVEGEVGGRDLGSAQGLSEKVGKESGRDGCHAQVCVCVCVWMLVVCMNAVPDP